MPITAEHRQPEPGQPEPGQPEPSPEQPGPSPGKPEPAPGLRPAPERDGARPAAAGPYGARPGLRAHVPARA